MLAFMAMTGTSRDLLTALEVPVVCLHSGIPALCFPRLIPYSRAVTGALQEHDHDRNQIDDWLHPDQSPKYDPMGPVGAK